MTLVIKHKATNNIFTDKHIREYLNYLIEIVRLKGKLKVCVRDIIYFIGLYEPIHLTRFGILLNKLSELGLAKRLTDYKPRKYRLEPQQLWLRYVEICDFRCNSDSTLCSLAGICPYWVLKNGYS